MDFVEAWRSGTVKRYHVMDTILPNLVSQHSWGVVLVLVMLWPEAPAPVLIGAEVHDFGEKATGDMPGPVKWGNPVLGAEMDRMEHEHMKARLPQTLLKMVDELETWHWGLIEMCDRAEFCMNMIHERLMGNKFAEVYYKRAWDKMSDTLLYNRPKFLDVPGLYDNIVAMRRNLDDNWREARNAS